MLWVIRGEVGCEAGGRVGEWRDGFGQGKWRGDFGIGDWNMGEVCLSDGDGMFVLSCWIGGLRGCCYDFQC